MSASEEDPYSATQVVERLRAQSLDISLRTLQNYVNAGLAPRPDHQNRGRAGGRVALFPAEAVGEVAASWELINGRFQIKLEFVAKARKIALHLESAAPTSRQQLEADGQLYDLILGDSYCAFLAFEWLEKKHAVNTIGNASRAEDEGERQAMEFLGHPECIATLISIGNRMSAMPAPRDSSDEPRQEGEQDAAS